jgi:MerR family mercuric resistance operon transcriptional regulator
MREAAVTPTYRIGEVADQTGITVETLRYYERLGLLKAPPRSSGGLRRYPATAVDRVRFIKQAQSLGLTLRDIQQLVGFRPGQGRTACTRIRYVLAQRIADLDARLADMQSFRTTLVEHLRACDTALDGRRDVDCPTLDALKGAAS